MAYQTLIAEKMTPVASEGRKLHWGERWGIRGRSSDLGPGSRLRGAGPSSVAEIDRTMGSGLSLLVEAKGLVCVLIPGNPPLQHVFQFVGFVIEIHEGFEGLNTLG